MSSESQPDEPLMSGEEDFLKTNTTSKKASSIWTSLRLGLVVVLTAVIAFGFGFGSAASKYQSQTTQDGLPNPEGDVKVFMEYNSTFSSAPSPSSDAAWESLFPKGKGFVRHPDIAPETSGLVVFHALHCLNALRHVYYAAMEGPPPSDHEASHHHEDPHHVRHCFDYLRQSLMCSADTNLELVDKDLKGVTGWGFERTCRDYDSVKAWAEENWSNEF